MTLLLTKVGRKQYKLYCPDVYGMRTWGTYYQEGIEKKKRCWYETYWHDNGEWENDTYIETKLNVVLETKDIDEVLAYVKAHNEKEISNILNDAKEIFDDYFAFTSYCLKRS